MRTTVAIFIGFALLMACCSACRTGARRHSVDFKPAPLPEVNDLWTWYWRVVAADWEMEAAESNRTATTIVPPIYEKLTSRKLRQLIGIWKCDFQWNTEDEPTTARIEFTEDHSFEIAWEEGDESGKWIERANRVELYRLVHASEPEFRFFVILTTNQWQLVNAEAAQGLTPLARVESSSNRETTNPQLNSTP